MPPDISSVPGAETGTSRRGRVRCSRADGLVAGVADHFQRPVPGIGQTWSGRAGGCTATARRAFRRLRMNRSSPAPQRRRPVSQRPARTARRRPPRRARRGRDREAPEARAAPKAREPAKVWLRRMPAAHGERPRHPAHDPSSVKRPLTRAVSAHPEHQRREHAVADSDLLIPPYAPPCRGRGASGVGPTNALARKRRAPQPAIRSRRYGWLDPAPQAPPAAPPAGEPPLVERDGATDPRPAAALSRKAIRSPRGWRTIPRSVAPPPYPVAYAAGGAAPPRAAKPRRRTNVSRGSHPRSRRVSCRRRRGRGRPGLPFGDARGGVR